MSGILRPIVFISLVIVLAALIAGSFFLLQAKQTPSLTAAQALAQACATIRNDSYDQVRTSNYPDGNKVISTFQYSAGDFQETTTSYGRDGTTILGKAESVFKDGTWYVRASLDLEDVDTLSPWIIAATNQHPVFPKGCSGDVQVSGASGADEEASLRHLVWEEQASSQVNSERNKWEMWVDADGRPVRGLITVYEIPEESETSGAEGGGASGASASSSSSPTPRAVYTIRETYSGFGETNTITAPIATPTPASPTPTSAVPTWTPVPSPTPAPATATPTPVPDGVLHIAVSADNTNPPANQPVNLTATVQNGPENAVPTFYWEISFSGVWAKQGSSSTLRYLGSAGETLGFRATVTYPNGVSLTSDPVSVTWQDPGT